MTFDKDLAEELDKPSPDHLTRDEMRQYQVRVHEKAGWVAHGED